jgi:hypothetical protein
MAIQIALPLPMKSLGTVWMKEVTQSKSLAMLRLPTMTMATEIYLQTKSSLPL